MIPILKMLGLSESGPRPQIAGLAGLNSMQPSIAGLSGIGSPSARAEQAAMPFEDRTWSTFTPAAGAQSRGVNDMPWVFSETQNIPRDPAALLRLFFQQPGQRPPSTGPGVPALQSGSNGGWQSEGTGNPALNQFPPGSMPMGPAGAFGGQQAAPPMIYWTGPGAGFVIENGAMRDATWEEMEFERQRKLMQAMGWGGGALGGSDVGTTGDVPMGGGWSGGASGNGGGWGNGWGGGGDMNSAGHEGGHGGYGGADGKDSSGPGDSTGTGGLY